MILTCSSLLAVLRNPLRHGEVLAYDVRLGLIALIAFTGMVEVASGQLVILDVLDKGEWF